MSDSDSTSITTSRVPSGFLYRIPWYPSNSDNLDEELVRECSRNHCLYGVKARAVAARQDCDDVLFELSGPGAPGEFAVVHLAYSGRERTGEFPSTTVFPTFQHWVTECMQPEADEWEAVEKFCEEYEKGKQG